jgi:PAS domain S-box-containing protein
MSYDTKTREQLIAEIEALRQRNDQLEALVTRRQQMEEALRKSEQRLSLHIQQTPLAYVEWDLGFQVVEWNPAAERMFGYSKSAALGQHAGLIVPEAARPLVDQIWDALLEQKGGTRSTNDNVTKDGRIIACEWYNTPLVDADGEVIGVASLVQDITERQQAEEALHQSMLQEEIIRKQSSILRELSTPLIPISDQVLVMPLVGR